MMNIAFDLDGVLYPWHRVIYNYIRENYKDFSATYTELWSNPYSFFTPEWWSYIASVPLMYQSAIPDKDIVDMLQKLDEEGHTIYYVTNREKELERVTRWFLETYNFPQAGNLIITKEKDHTVRTLEIDIFVEDKPTNLEMLSPLCKTLGIEHPWNEK
jgi:uncharacterized HAD superfamily protein